MGRTLVKSLMRRISAADQQGSAANKKIQIRQSQVTIKYLLRIPVRHPLIFVNTPSVTVGNRVREFTWNQVIL